MQLLILRIKIVFCVLIAAVTRVKLCLSIHIWLHPCFLLFHVNCWSRLLKRQKLNRNIDGTEEETLIFLSVFALCQNPNAGLFVSVIPILYLDHTTAPWSCWCDVSDAHSHCCSQMSSPSPSRGRLGLRDVGKCVHLSVLIQRTAESLCVCCLAAGCVLQYSGLL